MPVSISVLVPAYNPGRFLAPCLASVVPQLGPDDELVVQDSCSDDGSAGVLAAAAADARVQVRVEKDAGQSDGLNRALARAVGDTVLWLNADDLLLPGALDAVRAAAPAADVVVGGWQVVDGTGTVLREYGARALDRRALLRRGCYAFSGALGVRRDLLQSLGGVSRALHYAMDFDLMLRLMAGSPTQVVVPRSLAALRLHPASKTGAQSWRFARDALLVRRHQSRSGPEWAASAVGTAAHVAALATHELRFGPTYTRLRARLRP